MASLVPAGATVVFTPDAGWDWDGFDGCVEVSAGRDRMALPGGCVVLDGDLVRLGERLVGTRYKAAGHDVAGGVASATVRIDAGTLFERLRVEGRPSAKSDTTGTFRVGVVPSQKSGSPCVPDAATERTGTWAIRTPAGTRTTC